MAIETKRQERTSPWRRNIFFAVWAISTAALTLFLQQGWYTFGSPATWPTLMALLICTLTLLRWLPPVSVDDRSGASSTRRGRFILLVILVVVVLFALATIVGPPLLFALPVVAIIVLAVLRPHFDRRTILYALGLAIVAGIAGLGAGWIEEMSPPVWAGLQVALVLSALPAGWAILKHAQIEQIGVSRYLKEKAGPALRAFGLGILLGMPWALGLVVLGGSNGESWVQYSWQPFTAIQPAISEEAWARVLLVPLLFLLFRRVARTRRALTAAVLVMVFWFAYLHTSRDLSLGTFIDILMAGTLYSLPIAYLWLRRDLETAIGFHFWQDFVKFGFAYLLNSGFWIA